MDGANDLQLDRAVLDDEGLHFLLVHTCQGSLVNVRVEEQMERGESREETNKVDADGGHVGLAELVVLSGWGTRGRTVSVEWLSAEHVREWANNKAEEETRLANARLADNEELEEQVRSERAET